MLLEYNSRNIKCILCMYALATVKGVGDIKRSCGITLRERERERDGIPPHTRAIRKNAYARVGNEGVP